MALGPHRCPAPWRSLGHPAELRSADSFGGCAPGPHRCPAPWRSLGHPAELRSAEPVAQLALEDLAAGVARQLVDEEHPLRLLVAGERRPTGGDDLVLGDR